MSKESILLITCTVGYGHQMAAMNIERSLRQANPELNIIRLDTRDYFPPGIGSISDQWDEQIRKGHFMVSQIVQIQGPYEAFYALCLDWHLSRDIIKLFKQNNITAVYDTQTMFTPIMYKAVSKACAGRRLTYHKILTDLPTPRNSSFFTGIKHTRLKDHVTLKVHAPAPLLAPNETSDSFWKTHCKLDSSHIDTRFALPVHPHYLRAPADPHVLNIAVDPVWQLESPLPPETYVTTLMLGSQGVNAIYDYAMQYLAQLSAQSHSQTHYFFIACSKNETLYAALQSLLAHHPIHLNTPHRVIPLPMQNMDAVASLMWRSNQVIIRSGGISSLEQLALSTVRQKNHPKLWIHSAYKGTDSDALLDHIYSWERGNAEYLIQHVGARMTAPQLIDFFTPPSS